jgi:hypothetical protein
MIVSVIVRDYPLCFRDMINVFLFETFGAVIVPAGFMIGILTWTRGVAPVESLVSLAALFAKFMMFHLAFQFSGTYSFLFGDSVLTNTNYKTGKFKEFLTSNPNNPPYEQFLLQNTNYITGKPCDPSQLSENLSPLRAFVLKWSPLVVKYGVYALVILGYLFLMIASAMVRDVKFIEEHPWKYTAEVIVVGIIPSVIMMAVYSYTRKFDFNTFVISAIGLSLKFSLLHILFTISGVYGYFYPDEDSTLITH